MYKIGDRVVWVRHAATIVSSGGGADVWDWYITTDGGISVGVYESEISLLA